MKRKQKLTIGAAATAALLAIGAGGVLKIAKAASTVTQTIIVCTKDADSNSSYVDITPGQLASLTFAQVANVGISRLNTMYDPDTDWTLSDVYKIEAIVSDQYPQGAGLMVCVEDTFTVVPGTP